MEPLRTIVNQQSTAQLNILRRSLGFPRSLEMTTKNKSQSAVITPMISATNNIILKSFNPDSTIQSYWSISPPRVCCFVPFQVKFCALAVHQKAIVCQYLIAGEVIGAFHLRTWLSYCLG